MKKALLLSAVACTHRSFNWPCINALSDLGYEVHLAANFSDEGHNGANERFAKTCKKVDVVVHNFPFARSSLLRNLNAVSMFRHWLAHEEFQIIHAHTETGCLILKLAGSAAGKAVRIYTPHGFSFWEGSSLKSQVIYRALDRWVCGGIDAAIAINWEELSILEGWVPGRARFTHGAGVDLSRFQNVKADRAAIRASLGIPQEAFMLVAVGELNDNKNHRAMIEALVLTHNPNAHLLICGIGERRQSLLVQAQTMGITDRVTLAGYRKDIASLHYAADVFLSASHHEGLPVSMLEAMAAGLPVECSAIRGHVDLIEGEQGGYLLDADDVHGFADAVNRIADNELLRKAMCERNKTVVAGYCTETVSAEMRRIYVEAVL